MDWKNFSGIVATFVVFCILFSIPLVIEGKSPVYKSEIETEQVQRDSGGTDEGPSIASAPMEKEEEQVQDTGNVAWQSIITIVLLSMLGTLLSWTAVDQVFGDRSDVAVVNFREKDGQRIMDVLSNDTCRRIMEVLAEEEMTASQLSEKLDMSIQRVHYNLKKLKGSDLVASDKFRYSEKGNEMDVYTLKKKYFVLGAEE